MVYTMLEVISRKQASDLNLPRYFTGKPCKHGHISERRVNGHCVECERDWVVKNPDKKIDISRRYDNSLKGVRNKKVYAQSEGGKKSRTRAVLKYSKTEKGLKSVSKAQKKHQKSPQRKAYVTLRYSTNIQYRITRNLRTRLGNAFRSKGMVKSGNTFDLIGCSMPDLIEHLKSKFLPGMTMENYGGENGWVIDHKIPCCAFDLRCPLAVKLCFHFTNLQPLWYRDNLLKVKEDLQWQL